MRGVQRGSAWVKIRVWQILRNGNIDMATGETLYGYSAVTDLNNDYQRKDAFRKALNSALKIYRKTHYLSSDTELDYILLGSGINRVTKRYGYEKDVWYDIKISPADKRLIHKEVFLGKDKPMTEKEFVDEMTRAEYEHRKKKTSNLITVETGEIHKRKIKHKKISNQKKIIKHKKKSKR